MDTLIVIDGCGVIKVNSVDRILVREMVRHFRPRWMKEAEAAKKNGTEPNAFEMVLKMMKKMSIDFAPVEAECLTVLTEQTAEPEEPAFEDIPDEDALEYGDDVSAAEV